MNQILLRAQVPLGCLDRRMAKHHLDLLKFGTGCPAEFGAGGTAATIIVPRGCDRAPWRTAESPRQQPPDTMPPRAAAGINCICATTARPTLLPSKHRTSGSAVKALPALPNLRDPARGVISLAHLIGWLAALP